MKKETIKEVKIICSIFVLISLIGIVSSANYCCEKTIGGLYCMNENSVSDCDTTNGLRAESKFCEITSYCKLGTCIDTETGMCVSNTPKVACQKGAWSQEPKEALSQCKNVCCKTNGQVSFVPEVTCRTEAFNNGWTVSFDAILTEEECLMSGNPNDMGACVYTKDTMRWCNITAKNDCNKVLKNKYADATFYQGKLCTAKNLNTVCDRNFDKETICSGDNVYFTDSCGNLANVYDYSKKDDDTYWTDIKISDCTLTSSGGKLNNADKCGNCDSLLGTICKKETAGSNKADVGNYACEQLNCEDYTGEYTGKNPYPLYGESWCVTNNKEGLSANLPGGTSAVMRCLNGRVIPEVCGIESSEPGARTEICVETEYDNGIMIADCKINAWDFCTAQTTQETCEDKTMLDCEWQETDYYFTVSEGLKNDESDVKGMCFPKYAPGFSTKKNSEVAGGEAVCKQASARCYVKVHRGAFGAWLAEILGIKYEKGKEGWVCGGIGYDSAKDNCSCMGEFDSNGEGYVWAEEMNGYCTRLGDCGAKNNYLGKFGSTKLAELIEIVDVTKED